MRPQRKRRAFWGGSALGREVLSLPPGAGGLDGNLWSDVPISGCERGWVSSSTSSARSSSPASSPRSHPASPWGCSSISPQELGSLTPKLQGPHVPFLCLGPHFGDSQLWGCQHSVGAVMQRCGVTAAPCPRGKLVAKVTFA